jgi:hypothetical protein
LRLNLQSTSRSESLTIAADTWPEGEAILYQLTPGGKWLTWEQMRAARVDAIMPRQPKPTYRRK